MHRLADRVRIWNDTMAIAFTHQQTYENCGLLRTFRIDNRPITFEVENVVLYDKLYQM